jgi:hypothetical protein
MQRKLLGIIVDFDTAGQLLVLRIFCICQILEKKWEYSDAVYRLQESYDTIRREILYITGCV